MDTLTRTSSPPTGDMSGVLSLYKLLSQASSLPCSSGAAAFLSLASSENERFSLALDILLPVLKEKNFQSSQRILSAYVLHALYASHDHLNPFHDHLHHVFDSERTAIEAHARTLPSLRSSEILRSPQDGAASLQTWSEQLVWVLWKILKGEGDDLAPYSPDILSRTALPEHLRAAHLILQDSQIPSPHANATFQYHSASNNSSLISRSTSASSQAHLPYYELETPLAPSLSPVDSVAQYFPPALGHTQTSSTFSPFETEYNRHASEERSVTSEWRRDVSPQGFQQNRPQMQSNVPSRPDAHLMRPQQGVIPIPMREASLSSRVSATGDTRQEALLHSLLMDPQESDFQPRGRSDASTYIRTDHSGSSDRFGGNFFPGRKLGLSGPDLGSVSEPNLGLQEPSPTSPSVSSRTQRHNLTALTNGPKSLGRQPDAPAPSHSSTSLNNNPLTRPQLGPIARPKPSPSLSYNSTASHDASFHKNTSSLQHVPSQIYSQAVRHSPVDPPLQHAQGSRHDIITQNPETVSSGGLLNSMRNPGVIGSGRPSAKSISPVGSDAGERQRRTDFGVIGNGRPPRRSPVAGIADETPVGMVPRSTERTEQRNDGITKKDFGAIGRSNSSRRQIGERPTREEAAGAKVVWMQEELPVIDGPSTKPSAQGESSPNGDRQASMISRFSLEIPRHPDLLNPGLLRVGKSSSPNFSSTEDTSSSSIHSPVSDLTSSLNRLSIPPPTSPTLSTEIDKARPQLGDAQESLIRAKDMALESRPVIHEKQRDELSRAIVLLLSARERVLTLAEQRILMPHLPMLTRPLSLLRPGDLDPLVAKNSDVATKLLVLLLDRDDEDGTRIERTLREVSKNDLFHSESTEGSFDTSSFTTPDAADAVQIVLQSIAGAGNLSQGSAEQEKFSPFGGREAKEGYLEALRRLPPTMQSFNLIARLLRPVPGANVLEPLNSQDTPEVRVARLIKSDVLGGLVSGCVRWIEGAEQGEKSGEVLDDRVAVSVSSLSRFYTSLLKHGFVSAESEVDTTEIMSFALQFSRFEEACSLYSMLAAARG